MIPDRIGRYEVQGLLGEGAFGQVFAARDPSLGRVVAIKVLRSQFSSDSSFMDRFHAEAASLAALTHPNITLIYDLLESGQQHGMIMELVRGHTLEHVLERTSRLGLQATLAVTAQAVLGLGYIHRMGVVHRDIKPANLMLTESGLLKIMDFGIARAQGAKRLTRDGSIVGTLAYMAPEQIKRGEGEPRSDLYSLACVVYELLSGNPPFHANTEYDLMQAHMNAPPEPLSKRIPGIPDIVEQALTRALAKNPADRFASVEEFGRALGTDGVQAHAADVVREMIMKRADPIPPTPTRVMSVGPDATRSGATAASDPKPAGSDIRGPGRSRNRTPLLVLGGAALTVVAIVGFVVLTGGPTPGGPGASRVADETPAVTLAPTEPASVTPPAVREAVASKSVQNRDDLPQSSFIMPRDGGAKTALPAAPQSPEVKTAIAVEPQVPAKPLPLAAGTEPSASPAYQGRVVDWLGGGTIVVLNKSGNGPRYLRLFGVRDLPDGQDRADSDRHKLNAYLAQHGGKVTCFTRDGPDPVHPFYQCFADNKDIAIWAVGNHLARFAPDAPQDYREANQ